MVIQLQKDAGAGRNNLILFDTTGVSTASASETDLLVQTTTSGYDTTGVANGFINLGSFAGGCGYIYFYETAGAAGTLKMYSGLTASTTGAKEITGGGLAISASTADQYNVAVFPQFLRVTITRTAGNITVKYRIVVVKTGTM